MPKAFSVSAICTTTQHRSLALYALCALEVTGLMATVLLWQDIRGPGATKGAVWGLIGLALVASLLMAQTAHLGGLIRHEELTQGALSRIDSKGSSRVARNLEGAYKRH